MQRDAKIIVPMSLSRLYRRLLQSSRSFLNQEETTYIRKAFNLVWQHAGNTSYGEKMVGRALEIAIICSSELGLRSTSIVSCILFPLVACKQIDRAQIEVEFGSKVSEISDRKSVV